MIRFSILMLTLLAGIFLPACQAEQIRATSNNSTGIFEPPSLRMPEYRDLLVLKYDANGNQVWLKLFENSGQSGIRPKAASTDDQGNFYITGYGICDKAQDEYCTIKYDAQGKQLQAVPIIGLSLSTGGSIRLDNQGSITAVDYDPRSALVRYDGDGRLVWSAEVQKAVTGIDSLCCITVDRSGNTYIVGTKYIDFFHSDVHLIKYDREGNLLWNTAYPDLTLDLSAYTVKSLTITDQGDVYIMGCVRRENEKDPIHFFQDCTLVKFDSSGRLVWNTHYSGLGTINEPRDVTVDEEGNVCLLCLSDNADWYGEYATIKYDPDGNQLWERRYSPPYGGDDPRALAIDKLGNIYVTGVPSTIKYDSQGKELWAVEEAGYRLAIDDQNNIYVARNSNLVLPGSPTLDTVKLDGDGKVLWHTQYSKIWVFDQISLVTDSTGNVYIISSLSRYSEERNIK